MPGLALIPPNALVALVLYRLVWFVVTAPAAAGLLRHVSWSGRRTRRQPIVAVVGVGGLLAAPVVSREACLDPVLRVEGPRLDLDLALEVVGGRLRSRRRSGVSRLLALGVAWIALRARAALPVVAHWPGLRPHYIMAASSTAAGQRSSRATGTTTRSARLAGRRAGCLSWCRPPPRRCCAASPAPGAAIGTRPVVSVWLPCSSFAPLRRSGSTASHPAPDAHRLLPAERLPRRSILSFRGTRIAVAGSRPGSRRARASSADPRTAHR